MNFYHITTPEIWGTFENKNYYEAESLHTEGFIHCSYWGQLEETLKLYYKGVSQVIVLEIEPDALISKLIIEKSRDGNLFPHIYGVINKAAIVKVEERILQNNIV